MNLQEAVTWIKDFCFDDPEMEQAVELVCSEAQRAAELQAKIDSGELVVLPCKRGDKVYYLRQMIGEDNKYAIEISEVLSIEVIPNGFMIKMGVDDGKRNGYSHYGVFGKTVFLTSEAVEAALKERESSE